jgi:glutaredoxin
MNVSSSFKTARAAACLLLGVIVVILDIGSAVAQSSQQRNVLLEVYYTSGDALGEQYLAQAKAMAATRPGILVVPRDLRDNPANAERLKKIEIHFQIQKPSNPIIYGCNRVIRDVTETKALQSELEAALRFEVFARDGCSRCQAAKEVLPKFLEQYPALELSIRYVNRESSAMNEMNEIVRRHKTSAASVPVLHFCNQVQIGFERSSASTERLRKSLDRWTVAGKE